MDNPILTLKSVGKRFPGVVALRGVSLEVARGEGHVLLGENGAGKSTLINLLAGVYSADEGEILFDGQAYRPQNPDRRLSRRHPRRASGTLHAVADDGGREPPVRKPAAAPRAGELSRDEPPGGGASGGSRARGRADRRSFPASASRRCSSIEIAKALCYESKLLILDEPTATLTSKEVERLFEILRRLKARGVTILYISHRLHEIYEVGDRVTVLRDGQLVATRPLAGLTIPEIVHMMVGRSIEDEHAFREDVVVAGEALRVEGLRRNAKSPEVSFGVGKGEIVGVAGLVGSGRTETVRAIFGADPKIAGEIFVEGQRVEIASPRDAVRHGLCLMTEDRKGQGLLLGMSCAENITITDLRKISSHGILERDAERRRGDEAGRGAAHQDAVDRPDRCATSPAATSRRSSSPSGCFGARRSSSATSRRAASTSAPRRKSTISCGLWPRKAAASSSSRPTCRS